MITLSVLRHLFVGCWPPHFSHITLFSNQHDPTGWRFPHKACIGCCPRVQDSSFGPSCFALCGG